MSQRLLATMRVTARALHLLRPFWRGFAGVGALSLVVSTLGLFAPLASRLFVDRAVPARDVGLLNLLALGSLVFGVASSLVGSLQAYASTALNARVGLGAGAMLFSHILLLPLPFLEGRRIGDVMSRFGDLRSGLGFVVRAVDAVLNAGVAIVVLPPLLFLLHPQLATLTVLSAPLAAAIGTVGAVKARSFREVAASVQGELAAVHTEVVSQVRWTKALCRESVHVLRALQLSQDALMAEMRAQRVQLVWSTAAAAARLLIGALATWYAWREILAARLSLGDYIAFAALAGLLQAPSAQVAALFVEMNQTGVSLERAFELLDRTPEAPPTSLYAPAVVEVVESEGLVATDVSVAYTPLRPALRNVSLTFEPGTITAIVGASGAGKSTLLRALSAMSPVSAGEVRLGDQTFSELGPRAVRRRVTMVWQDVALQRASVWENLTWGTNLEEDALRLRVENALRVSDAQSVVAGLPAGLQTMVSEWGQSLSGGQRQRIALAAALVRSAPILLLDEALSQLDVSTEALVLHNLRRELGHRIIVMVTHRLSSARLADRIVVLHDGVLAGVGSHLELMEKCAPYQRLCDTETVLREGPASSLGSALTVSGAA